MNIIFFGSDNFSVLSLKAILNSGHKLSCVVTQPDKKKGRGLSISPTPVKSAAEKAGLKTYQPLKVNAPESIEFLKSFDADLFVVVAYGQILSQGVLDIPKKFCLNIHASFLPKYRGAAPINWAIINGDKVSGVTAMKIEREMDAGPVIMQNEVPVKDDDTAIMLEERLSLSAAALLKDTLKAIEKDKYDLKPQDGKIATFAPKLKKEGGLISWSKPALDIYNLIRGCLPWPGAFTYYKGKLLKIYRAQSVRVSECQSVRASEYQSVREPGEIIEVSKNGIMVASGKDNLLIKELQIEGKRVMSAQEFIAGHKIRPGDKLE